MISEEKLDIKFSYFRLFLLFRKTGVVCYEICGYSVSTYKYCEDGYHCCENDDTLCCADVTLAVGAIVGIVISSLFFIGCCVAVVCAVVKKRHRLDQVNQPASQPGVAVISTAQQLGQPMYGQPMYGQPSYGQPQFGGQQVNGGRSSDPVYPPPPPAVY